MITVSRFIQGVRYSHVIVNASNGSHSVAQSNRAERTVLGGTSREPVNCPAEQGGSDSLSPPCSRHLVAHNITRNPPNIHPVRSSTG